jgi:hypothetical protein
LAQVILISVQVRLVQPPNYLLHLLPKVRTLPLPLLLPPPPPGWDRDYHLYTVLHLDMEQVVQELLHNTVAMITQTPVIHSVSYLSVHPALPLLLVSLLVRDLPSVHLDYWRGRRHLALLQVSLKNLMFIISYQSLKRRETTGSLFLIPKSKECWMLLWSIR